MSHEMTFNVTWVFNVFNLWKRSFWMVFLAFENRWRQPGCQNLIISSILLLHFDLFINYFQSYIKLSLFRFSSMVLFHILLQPCKNYNINFFPPNCHNYWYFHFTLKGFEALLNTILCIWLSHISTCRTGQIQIHSVVGQFWIW